MEYIQNEHDKALFELEKQKQSLKKRLSSVEKLDLLINALTHKIFEIQYQYQKQIKELGLKREETLNKEGISKLEKEKLIDDIDKAIKNLENVHKDEITGLENQRSSLQTQCATKTQHMDVMMDSLKEQHRMILKELEESKTNATPSQLKEINRRIAELHKLFQKDIKIFHQLQSEGWKNKEEKMFELLQSRGICVTQSNKFLTSSGSHLTRSEASRLGLLEGINVDLLSDVFDEQQEEYCSESQLSSDLTILDKMDTDDVLYLKTIFAKPLTLALAEITAKQPRDPIHYLGHWLFKYRYNQEMSVKRKHEIQELIDERERLEKEKLVYNTKLYC
ncbi:hypothetical protein RI129_003429 [Pyrocoelia pectoralis]|uniref:Uncharacterized protein n=1 Tax=Pyrocoelia pectoralis TaxID=417401 RepID=A0AAN7VI10_9COLE